MSLADTQPQVDFSFEAGNGASVDNRKPQASNSVQNENVRDRNPKEKRNTGAISKRSRHQYYDQQRYERNNNSNGGYNSNGQRPDNNNGRNNRRRDNWRNYRDINKSSPQKKPPDASLDNSPKHSNSSLDGEPIGVVSPRSSELSLDSQKCSQRDKLIREIEARKLECLVCVEPIKGHHSVWSCSNCYHILHLVCTTKWASSSQSNDGWRCPACQNVTKTIPREYYCFCGKLKNPPYNRSDVAHSCGETCGRKDACPHPCTLLCHPGPCPPCQVMVQRECGCGRTKKSMQCCIREDIECDNKITDRTLF